MTPTRTIGRRLPDGLRAGLRAEALGAIDPPRIRAGVLRLPEDSVPHLGVTLPTVRHLNPLAPWRRPAHQRPVYALVQWATSGSVGG